MDQLAGLASPWGRRDDGNKGLSESAKVASVSLTRAVNHLPEGEETMNLLLLTSQEGALEPSVSDVRAVHADLPKPCPLGRSKSKGRDQWLCLCS